MPSLRELQTQVMDALLALSPDSAAPLVLPSSIEAESRLRIYQGNVRNNFAEALRSTFPVIWRLVGEDYFRQTAWAFQRQFPSRSGDLTHAGESFPDHLRELHGFDAFAYLADVARLEWLIQESLLAADHGPLDLQALARVDAAAYDSLHFALHPTLRLFESAFPALRIWEANTGENEPPLMDLDCGGERLAIMRQRGQLMFHPLNRGEYGFLAALADGRCFEAAVEDAAGSDAQFDAASALQRFVTANAIVGCGIQDKRH
jgi:hypothetical protein